MAKLYVVGIGPGGADHMTPAACAAIAEAQTVVGYKNYLDLIPHLLGGKDVRSSGMMREVERCRLALSEAADGRTVALVSSGDAGIYGMAGLALELAGESPVTIEVVPGVSAVQAAAARLGAPLMHDFAVVSLSDLLTPWPLIRRRLAAAAAADFVVALYNPRSKGRTTQIGEARDLLLRRRSPATPVGIVRNACRTGEEVTVTDLAHLLEHPIDMLSLVIVGNSQTRLDAAGRMVTPRGYAVRREESGVRSRNGEASGVTNEEKKPLPLTPHPSPLTNKKCSALFVGGTGSDVGKSVLTAGLCRILARRGLSVAPFKAQNMALNSAVTPEGGEIGRAQALQAAACGRTPHTDMNPVLLKPSSDTGSQVILQGRPVGNMSVAEYHAFKPEAFAAVEQAYRRLAAACDVVVLEGAGSIAEINLKAHDITNLRAAAMAGAPALLVADIDRGGVFAAIVGTLDLLEPAERERIVGVVINKFRGDAQLLRPGIEEVEARTGVPVLGVVPWIDLRLPEEDSVALARKGAGTRAMTRENAVRIGVVRLPRISNYTDFDPLEGEPDVELVYLDRPEEIAGCDLLILPGSKSTLADLEFLHRRGFAAAIAAYRANGGRIAGICGGYQMLGRRIADPQGAESSCRGGEGLGLLDVETVLKAEKQTHQAEGVPLADAGALFAGAARVTGYEIHLGETTRGPAARPLLRLTRISGTGGELEDGAVSPDGAVWGTYLHGIFDEPGVRRAVIDDLLRRRGFTPGAGAPGPTLEEELDRLAAHLQRHLDLRRLFGLMGLDLQEAG